MSLRIDEQDIIKAQELLAEQGPEAMYDYLASKGTRYARLANGAATGESFAGKAAIKFMQQAAWEVGKPMGQDLVNVIKQAMARQAVLFDGRVCSACQKGGGARDYSRSRRAA